MLGSALRDKQFDQHPLQNPIWVALLACPVVGSEHEDSTAGQASSANPGNSTLDFAAIILGL